MAIPFATTTIAILRQADEDLEGEPYQDSPYLTIATGIRAVVSMSPQNRGEETTRGGERSKVKARLSCDPCDLRHTDRVKDLTTNTEWTVEYSEPRVGLGVDHVTAGLFRTGGLI